MQPSLPPGPSYPSLIQGVGLWTRPLGLPREAARPIRQAASRCASRSRRRSWRSPSPIRSRRSTRRRPRSCTRARAPACWRPLVGPQLGDPARRGRAHGAAQADAPAPSTASGWSGSPDLVAEVDRAARSRAGRAGPSSSCTRACRRLTLEIILRAVFGLDPGPRLDALRDRSSPRLLAFGDSPMTPAARAARSRMLPLHEPRRAASPGFFDTRDEVDRLLFEQIDERRRELGGPRRHPLDAARRPPRGRVADERPGAARRADDAARRRPRDHRFDAGLGLRAPRPRAAPCCARRSSEEIERRRRRART